MIKYLPLCLIIFAGCALDTESGDEYTDEVVVVDEKSEKPDWSGANGPPHDLGCPGEVFELPGGGTMYIPGLCAPFYIYKGYPDPTEKDFEDPYDGEHQFNNRPEEQ